MQKVKSPIIVRVCSFTQSTVRRIQMSSFFNRPPHLAILTA